MRDMTSYIQIDNRMVNPEDREGNPKFGKVRWPPSLSLQVYF